MRRKLHRRGTRATLHALGMATAGMLLAAAPAQASILAVAACDAGDAVVLAADPAATGEARAIWLDRHTLRWPGAPRAGRYRLYHGKARLGAVPGQRVRGADGHVALEPVARVDAAVQQRFGHVAAGATLGLALHGDRLGELFRQSLLLVREDARGRVLEATATQLPGALDDIYAAAAEAPMPGAHPSADGTRFSLWAPTARAASVCIHADDQAPASQRVAAAFDPATGMWSMQLPQDLRGRYYTWLVDVHAPGTGLVRNRVTDPYSVSLGTDSRRSYIADLDDPDLMPDGWADAPRPPALAAQVDMSVYELHVRDFSINDATVPAALRGRYRAFTADDSDGIGHLRALARAGLTDVHLLPVYDIASVPEDGCVTPAIPEAPADSPRQQAAVMEAADRDCFNWGYDPFHFNAPEGSYASDPADGAVRIREFRAMVMALHRMGLRVGMDVVYNHTFASGQERGSVLDRIVPGYYHRLDANGTVETSTCCANTATEHAMMARLMIDSAELWVRHYRIDSFRFDLMGHQPRAAMEDLQRRVNAAAGRHVPLIGEGWNFGEVADGARFVQASQLSLGGSGIGTFSDRGRDALRGGGPGDSGRDRIARQGWLNGLGYAPNSVTAGDDPAQARAGLLRAADLVRAGLAGTVRDYVLDTVDGPRPLHAVDYNGQPAGYAHAPGEVVNYVENHDNETLYDLNAYRLPQDTPAAERARVQVLGMATTALSQGVAYFHAGVDTLRSKSLDRNSYNSGDWFNRLDWTYRDNHFGTGLPPAPGNGADWEWMAPRLADPALRPAPEDIAFARDALRQLLAIRSSSSLFRLPTAEEISRRLSFPGSGPAQNPVLVAGLLDGRDHPGANFDAILYLLNASPEPQQLAVPEQRGRRWVLHPRQRAADAYDPRVREAQWDPRSGTFTVPPRTVLVYVLE